MSTQSLLSYARPPESLRAPSYTAEPLANEQRIALSDHARPRPNGSFVKQSKHGHIRLRLTAQENGVAIPVYGIGGAVEGKVEMDAEKTEEVDGVEVKIEGRLKLNEVAEGGTSFAKLVLDTALLWAKGQGSEACPTTLSFSLSLPITFTFEGATYPLPPTYNVKLKGLPGFTASIDYSVSASINRPNTVPSMVPLVKSKALGISIGTTTISTPFLYLPRTRPAVPLPSPLQITSPNGFQVTPEWACYETRSIAKRSRLQDVTIKLYVPKCRIFCLKEPIPFHLAIESSAMSLVSFLPFGPSVGPMNSKVAMKMEILRQATVDVQNELVADAKQDMWRVDCIGQGTFNHTANDTTFSAFSGEVRVFDTVQIGGFKAAGLSVKDCIVLSMNPPDPKKCPFRDFRIVAPIRFATDPWRADGTGIGIAGDMMDF